MSSPTEETNNVLHRVSLRNESKRIEEKLGYLGSHSSAACLTLPQYVLRSYFEAGRSRLPGIEDDMYFVGVGKMTVSSGENTA